MKFGLRKLYEADGSQGGSDTTTVFGGLSASLGQFLDTSEKPIDDEKKKDEIELKDEEKKEDKLPETPKPEDTIDHWRGKAAEMETKLSELQKRIDETPAGDVEMKEFLEGLKKDFTGTYKSKASKFGLPDLSDIGEEVASKDYSKRLKNWQDKTLVKDIEKKFNLTDGEFEYVADDAYKAGTPSYEFRRMTAQKEAEFENEFQNSAKQNMKIIEDAKVRQETDMKFIADSFYGGDLAQVTGDNGIMKKLDMLVSNISTGKEPQDKHPFELRNLVRGVFFDDFVKVKVDNAVNDLKQQFEKAGLFLPKHDAPTDVTMTKSKAPKEKSTAKEFSPLLGILNGYNQ